MAVIYILLGISMFFAFIFLMVFIWNIRSGQYEDDYTPSIRMLFDEQLPKQGENTSIE